MTPADRLIVGNTDMSLDDANRVMQDARKGRLSRMADHGGRSQRVCVQASCPLSTISWS